MYVRVSTTQQVQTQTIDQQIDRLRAHSHTHGWAWNDTHLFRNDGYRGASLRRPGLDRLRDLVATASVDRVIITTPDRLARKYVHQMLLIEEFDGHGCQVEFIDQPMSQDPNDQLLLQIRGAVAEYERTLIAERLRRGRYHKYRAGTLLPWTRPPYGYLMDPDQPRALTGVRVDPVAAALVTEIFAHYLEPGHSLSSIGKHLMTLQVPAPSGGSRWTHASLRRILTNPVYTGVVYAGRSRVRPVTKRRSPLTPVGQRQHGLVPTPPEEWIEVGHIPAIIAPEQFAQVQAKIATNGRFARRNNTRNPYLLRALVSCGVCRLACVGQTRRRYAYYTCAGRSHPVLSCREERCRARHIPMRQLDEVVWNDVCAVLQHPETLAVALARAQEGAWLPQELQARRTNLRKAQRSLTQQIERLTTAYLEQILNLDEYRRRRHDLEQRVAALAQQVAQLDVQVDRQAELTQATAHMTTFCERVSASLATATFAQKRQLLELLIDRIVVTNEEVEIRYVIPTSTRSEHTHFYHLRIDYCRALSPLVRVRMLAHLPPA
jgi:site-specific DNA recombinase